MKRPAINGYGVLAGVIFCFIVSAAYLIYDNQPVSAQSAAPAWEYAALAYDGDTAFAYTNDPTANNEINKLYDAMDADSMTSIAVMNILGERGWEYVDYQPGSPVVYMFRRPLE